MDQRTSLWRSWFFIAFHCIIQKTLIFPFSFVFAVANSFGYDSPARNSLWAFHELSFQSVIAFKKIKNYPHDSTISNFENCSDKKQSELISKWIRIESSRRTKPATNLWRGRNYGNWYQWIQEDVHMADKMKESEKFKIRKWSTWWQ